LVTIEPCHKIIFKCHYCEEPMEVIYPCNQHNIKDILVECSSCKEAMGVEILFKQDEYNIYTM
jgi:hypothetical protein